MPRVAAADAAATASSRLDRVVVVVVSKRVCDHFLLLQPAVQFVGYGYSNGSQKEVMANALVLMLLCVSVALRELRSRHGS